MRKLILLVGGIAALAAFAAGLAPAQFAGAAADAVPTNASFALNSTAD